MEVHSLMICFFYVEDCLLLLREFSGISIKICGQNDRTKSRSISSREKHLQSSNRLKSGDWGLIDKDHESLVDVFDCQS